ncbi:hypothetical protein AJ80_07993 [Polytolypa hystricis UAMH7299]|uniref:Uncharacterized protein n=1 Tax=Polytolypa hystricis (strain UAMH7299) TaxID=1447883 RepID=A0A2B7XFN4_POLH7|nr:hypothetical protein AJ80_07993 [Polytolypa hystricis UAMH7299]
MNTKELKEDLYELYCNRSSHRVPDITSVWTASTEWKLGPIFTERETYGDDNIYNAFITEAAGGIGKIRMQIPDDPDDPSSTKPQHGSTRSGFDGLTFGSLQNTNLPAHQSFGILVPSSNQKMTLEFYSLRFVHKDPDRRNLIWDRENKKCYIIDLEDAHQINDDAEPRKFIPETDFHTWGIAGPEINTSMYGLDPWSHTIENISRIPMMRLFKGWVQKLLGRSCSFPNMIIMLEYMELDECAFGLITYLSTSAFGIK